MPPLSGPRPETSELRVLTRTEVTDGVVLAVTVEILQTSRPTDELPPPCPVAERAARSGPAWSAQVVRWARDAQVVRDFLPASQSHRATPSARGRSVRPHVGGGFCSRVPTEVRRGGVFVLLR